MKRLMSAIAFLLFWTGIEAQEISLDFLNRAANNLVTLEYRFNTIGEVTVTYSGILKIQQGLFKIEGNGVEIFCDGKCIYVVDPKAKEVYIQSPEKLETFVKDNIGTVKNFKISKMSTLPLTEDLSQFQFDVSSLDKTWVITDLRQQ